MKRRVALRKGVIAGLVACALVLLALGGPLLREPVPEWTPPTAGVEPIGPGAGYLRGAHWFGDAWAVNHWNTDLLSRAERDFAALRADGFNTVILVVPWAGFMATPESQDMNPDRRRRLDELLTLAEAAGLNAVLRVGYAWDAAERRSGGWNVQLWLNEAVRAGWLAYLGELGRLVEDHPHVRFGFISWEDLWAITGAGERELKRRLRVAGVSGYRDWLRERYSLAEVASRYDEDFSGWEDVPVPDRFHPSFALFFAFMDYAWIEHFFKPAQAVFPRLSMEIRVDVDPVWKAPGEIDHYHAHHAAWRLPGAAWTTIYWSPAMDGMNQGETLSPRTAAQRLQAQLERIHGVIGDQPIFVGQFLVEDFTPGYEHNGRLARDEVDDFLARAAPVLRRHAHGYALWAWRDYRHNAVPSPDFFTEVGNWDGQEGPAEDGAYALDKGDVLAREFQPHEFHVAGGATNLQICARGRAALPSTPALVVRVTPGAQGIDLTLSKGGERCADVTAGPELTTVTLEALQPVALDSIDLFGFEQPIGMRDRGGEAKPIAEAWRRLNEELVTAHPRWR